jgi:hypothetical protein
MATPRPFAARTGVALRRPSRRAALLLHRSCPLPALAGAQAVYFRLQLHGDLRGGSATQDRGTRLVACPHPAQPTVPACRAAILQEYSLAGKMCGASRTLIRGRTRIFYSSSRLTLNVTRRDMVLAGYSPSVCLFEAAACGAAIASDHWPGLETFFSLDEEILLPVSSDDVVRYLTGYEEFSEQRAQQFEACIERSREPRELEFTAADSRG